MSSASQAGRSMPACGKPICRFPASAAVDASGRSRRRWGSFQASRARARSEEHTSELQSLMRISYAVFCLKKKTPKEENQHVIYSCTYLDTVNSRINYDTHQQSV